MKQEDKLFANMVALAVSVILLVIAQALGLEEVERQTLLICLLYLAKLLWIFPEYLAESFEESKKGGE